MAKAVTDANLILPKHSKVTIKTMEKKTLPNAPPEEELPAAPNSYQKLSFAIMSSTGQRKTDDNIQRKEKDTDSLLKLYNLKKLMLRIPVIHHNLHLQMMAQQEST